MLYRCLRGFFPGTLISTQDPRACIFRLTGDTKSPLDCTYNIHLVDLSVVYLLIQVSTEILPNIRKIM